MWTVKYGTNEPIYKTELDSQTQNCGCQGGRKEGGDRLGGLGQQMQTIRVNKE